MQQPAIQCKALTKTYGKARGVENLDIVVETGAFYGFIGPNGAGKSTTIRAFLGLIAPTAGSVRVLGLNPANAAQRTALLAKVGYLPSETQFYPDMRVAEVIALSARLHRKHCAAEAARLCERLELDTSKKIEQLSLGNRKKAGIVCAMQHDPDLYILDEPTSGLDPLMQRVFFELLEEKHAEGKTIFFSSHVLGEVQRHCTCAAVLRQGCLAAQGSVSALAGTTARCISLQLAQGAQGVLPAALQGLPGIATPTQVGHNLQFLYTGQPAPLLAALAALPGGMLQDVTITEPGLEEVFLHYYTEGV
ncbi:MAG: ABC transporter ATP-binding protein [Gemmiger sp.]|nr:ABC transporter ATP-binding protein [Gemmiger sp.]